MKPSAKIARTSRKVSATAETLIAHLRSLRSPKDIEGQRRFGITPKTEHLGTRMGVLRQLARRHRRDHALALALWSSGIHEARILAALVGDPARVTRQQMNAWCRDFDSWDGCDQVCGELFVYTPFAQERALSWTKSSKEFMKRAGFVMMARLAVRRKDLLDGMFADWLPVLTREANDERNFVRKAVNWALRQIGKRSSGLRRASIAEAKKILALDTRSARWIATDALRELAPPPPAKSGKKASPSAPSRQARRS